MKKIEIIARITDDNEESLENSLMVWPDTGGWHKFSLTSSMLCYSSMEICLDQHRVLRDGANVRLSKYEYDVLVFLTQHSAGLQ